MKAGDRDPPFTAVLSEMVNGVATPINLTNASVTLTMFGFQDIIVVFTSSATITDAVNGAISYQWGPFDTINAGNYLLLIHVTDLSTGFVRSFPDSGYIDFKIDINYQ